MNAKNNECVIFEPDFFERIILAESLSYESPSFLTVANFILIREMIFHVGDIVALPANNSTSVLMKSIKDYRFDLCITSHSGYVNEKEYCKRRMKATILRHRHAVSGHELIEKEDAVSLFLPPENFFSKVFFYGGWRSGLKKHLYKTMRNFIHTKENHFNSGKLRKHI